MSPRRKKDVVNSMSRREAFEALHVDATSSSREIRQQHRMLARKNYPGKWSERCRLVKKEGEGIFKNLSSAHSTIGSDSRRQNSPPFGAICRL